MEIKLYGKYSVEAPVALIDDDDYELVGAFEWYCRRHLNDTGPLYYAQTNHNTVHMHRLILNAPKGVLVDHINRNGLDNRKNNLRLATVRVNASNSRREKSSEFPGVYRDYERRKWGACITVDGKTVGLGRYDDEMDAARAYEDALVGLE